MTKPAPIYIITLFVCLNTITVARAQVVLDRLDSLSPLSLVNVMDMTLASNWEIRNQTQAAKYYYGVYQMSSGKFDYQLNTKVQKNILNSPQYTIEDKIIHQYSNVLSYQVGITKQFDNGITVYPNMLATISESKFNNQNPYQKRYQSQVAANLTIIIPLLQNSGKESSTAQIRADHLTYEANIKTLKHTVSNAIYNTVSGYWAYATAYRQCKLVKEVLAGEKKYLEEIKSLAKADIVPFADTLNISASIGTYQIMLINYVEVLLNARRQLGLSIGIRASQIDSLGFPLDYYPEINNTDNFLQDLSNINMDDVYKMRSDYQALLANVKADKSRLKQAEDIAKPKLDLNLTGGYSGFEASDNYQLTAPYTKNIFGPSVWLSVDFQLPVTNQKGKGYLTQSHAIMEQTNNQLLQLMYSIQSEIRLSAEKLNLIHSEYQKQISNAGNLSEIYENEKRKYKEQESTLIDINNTRTRLLSAQLNIITILEKYYLEVIKFRFTSGTLISAGDVENKLGIEKLVSLPGLNEFKQ